MKKYLTLLASFVIMLCIGSVYAWSVIASELIGNFHFTIFQTQLVFGVLIAIFPVSMIFVGKIRGKFKHRYFGYASGILFFLGYYIASYSQGNFLPVLIGIGFFAGVATGLGYWVALTTPVLWFPQKKGLITGIAAAGFGLGAIFMSKISEIMINNGSNVFQLLKIIGIFYGLIILLFSNCIYQTQSLQAIGSGEIKARVFIKLNIFKKLFLGIFFGTFAGLLVIGSLKIIGSQYNITNHNLILGVTLFAIANFLGRLVWGALSDYIGASFSIFLALLVQSLSILSLGVFMLTDILYLMLAMLIGFGFGGNFVLFAKETSQVFGVQNVGIVYPYVFLGYAIAGITGPISCGFLFDLTGTFSYPIFLAAFMSFLGSFLFFKQFLLKREYGEILT